MDVHLYMICCFSIAAVNILSSSLVFVILITVYLCLFLFGLIPYGTLISWTLVTVSFFPRLRTFSAIILFKYFLSPFLSAAAAATAAKSLQPCQSLCHPIDGSPSG